MSSDIYFIFASWFPGNVLVKPHFNTNCPCPPPLRRPWPVSEWRRAQFLYSNDALRKHFWVILAWKFSWKCHKRIYLTTGCFSHQALLSLFTMFLERISYQSLFFEVQKWTFNLIYLRNQIVDADSVQRRKELLTDRKRTPKILRAKTLRVLRQT